MISIAATQRNWVYAFVAAAIGSQLGLFFLGGSAIRLPLRMVVYAMSLALIRMMPGRSTPHPAWRWACGALGILVLALVNPNGDNFVARFAIIVLYLSVLAPFLWMGRVPLTLPKFQTIIWAFWLFYTLSATMGVLQANYPGRFDGALANTYDPELIKSRLITLADGTIIMRPQGLTDSPGGAGVSGVNAIVLGFGLLLTDRTLLRRAIIVAGMMAGLFCIFISHGRVNLVVVAITLVALIVVLVRRGATGKLIVLGGVSAAVVFVGTVAAFSVGGDQVIERFASLIADDPKTVFQANRGMFIDEILDNHIYSIPLGAGLGRWGMVNNYFGTPQQSMWAEMLWQSLIYDGGIPLVLAYICIFGSMLRTTWMWSKWRGNQIFPVWAGVFVGYNLATVAASFVFPIMAVQTGAEVVFLNACLASLYFTEMKRLKLKRLQQEQAAFEHDHQAVAVAGLPAVAMS